MNKPEYEFFKDTNNNEECILKDGQMMFLRDVVKDLKYLQSKIEQESAWERHQELLKKPKYLMRWVNYMKNNDLPKTEKKAHELMNLLTLIK